MLKYVTSEFQKLWSKAKLLKIKQEHLHILLLK